MTRRLAPSLPPRSNSPRLLPRTCDLHQTSNPRNLALKGWMNLPPAPPLCCPQNKTLMAQPRPHSPRMIGPPKYHRSIRSRNQLLGLARYMGEGSSISTPPDLTGSRPAQLRSCANTALINGSVATALLLTGSGLPEFGASLHFEMRHKRSCSPIPEAEFF